MIEAGRWIDASLQNKLKMAETVADKSYVNTGVDAINQRILGRYQNGLGKTWDDPNHMKFFNDGCGELPVPVRRHVVPHAAQALGPAEGPPRLPRGGQADQPDRALQAGAPRRPKVSVPKDPMRASKLVDGVVWDGKDPAKYADSFKVRASAA